MYQILFTVDSAHQIADQKLSIIFGAAEIARIFFTFVVFSVVFQLLQIRRHFGAIGRRALGAQFRRCRLGRRGEKAHGDERAVVGR